MPTKPNTYVLVQTPEDDPMEREHTSRVRVPDLTIAKLVSHDIDDGTVMVQLPARTVDGHKVPVEDALLEASSVFGLEWAGQLSPGTRVCLDLMTLRVPDPQYNRPWQKGCMIVELKHNCVRAVNANGYTYKLGTADLTKWNILPARSVENRGLRTTWALHLLSGSNVPQEFRRAVTDLTAHHLRNSTLNSLWSTAL